MGFLVNEEEGQAAALGSSERNVQSPGLFPNPINHILQESYRNTYKYKCCYKARNLIVCLWVSTPVDASSQPPRICLVQCRGLIVHTCPFSQRPVRDDLRPDDFRRNSYQPFHNSLRVNFLKNLATEADGDHAGWTVSGHNGIRRQYLYCL